MGFEWIFVICPHTRGKSRSSSKNRERPYRSTQCHSASTAISAVSPRQPQDALTPLLNDANCSRDRTPSSRTEEATPVAYLEIVVADVQQWQMQIQAMMQYVSKRNRLGIDELQHIWKLRIANLQKQNRDLLSTLDLLGGEKLRTEAFVDRLRKEIENRNSEIAAMEEREKQQEISHHQEIAALETRLRKLQRQNIAIKRLVDCEEETTKGDVIRAIASNSGDVDDASPADRSRESAELRSEAEAGTQASTTAGTDGTALVRTETLSKRMETMHATAQAIESQLRNETARLRSASSRKQKNRDQLSETKTGSGGSSGVSSLPKTPTEAMPVAPKTPSGVEEQSSLVRKSRIKQRTSNQRLRTPRQSDMTSSVLPLKALKLQPTWRP